MHVLADLIPGVVVGPDAPAVNFAREKRLTTLECRLRAWCGTGR